MFEQRIRSSRTLVFLALMTVLGFASSTVIAEDEQVAAECDPGLSGKYTISGDDDAEVLKDKNKKKVKIKKSGKKEKPGDGFKKSWKDGKWENKTVAGKCVMKGTIEINNCTHEVMIQKTGVSDGKIEIEATLGSHTMGTGCEAHKQASNHHGTDAHGGTSHGKAD